MTRREFARDAALASTAASASALFSQAAPEAEREFFYRPVDAWAADFIPFYANGKYYLYYLHDWRNKEKYGGGTPWYLITTGDFVHFTEHGEMLARNPPREYNVFTGSVIAAKGKYHIFYVGQNSELKKQGLPGQVIMHATSDDLLKWTKIPEHTFQSPRGKYEPDDWRDPFVFWNPRANEYWMLVTRRLTSGPPRRRGCIVLCASKDLAKWEVRDPFYAPGLYHTHECADLFRIGEWWYLLFSEYSEQTVTRYRMARSLQGPWLTPADDTFDGRAFYAAKTASDGKRRFLFGWLATRTDRKDYQRWNWGGNLVVHEIFQEAGGTLRVTMPQPVDAAFAKPLSFRFAPGLGNSAIAGNQLRLAAPGSFGCAVAGQMPARCKVEMTIEFERLTRGCGIMLRSSDDLESAYYIRLEPGRGRLVFDAWPRPGDVPHMVELERPIDLRPGAAVPLKVIADGSCGVVYAAGKVAMSFRMYNLQKGNWGVFVNDGTARFRDVSISG